MGAVVLLIEFESEILNMIDSLTSATNNMSDDFFVTQSGAGHDGIVDMGVNTIGWLRYCSHAALCPIGGTASNVVFGKDNNPCMGR
tara:strand:+ start:2805 stop:3062 length:258 start_codon:yes stop_codon:yes gene_type:complete